jgi:hypothetical protein
MKRKHFLLTVLVIASSVLTRAQAPPQAVRHMTGGLTVHTLPLVIEAAEAYVNDSTGQMDFVGPVSVRPAHMPLTIEVPATNAAGAPFPPPEPLAMSLRGSFDITIGKIVLHADEADLDGRTGKMELRGHVRTTLQR